MPIQQKVDHERRIVFFTVTDTLDTNEMIEAVNEAFSQRKPGAVYDVLSDNRQVSAPARPDQIGPIVSLLQRLGGIAGMRAAMVVATDASYGMMRMLGAHLEPHGVEMGIFRNCAEAHAFIDRRAQA